MRPERGSNYKRNQKIPRTAGIDGFFAPKQPVRRRLYIDAKRHLIDPQVIFRSQAASQTKPLNKVKATSHPKVKQTIKINMALPGKTEDGASRYSIRQLNMLKLTTGQIIKRGFSVVVAVLMLIAGGMALQFYISLNQALHGDGETVAALQSNADQIDPNALRGEGSGRVNILLLGRGGAGHPGGDLTDTIMIASIDTINDDLALLSVPRDLWINSPIGGTSKINAVYYNAKTKALNNKPNDKAGAESAGATAIKETVSEVIGLPISYYAVFDFTAFKEAVDVVGGITINVPSDLYDPSIAWENNNNPLIAKQGVQTMDGNQALLYVRSRKTTSDFARAERQRAVIEAIAQASMKAGVLANPIKITELVKVFGDHFSSDLSISNAQRLISVIKPIDLSKARSIGLTESGNNFLQTDRVGDQSVVRPVAGFNNYEAIRSFVRNNIRDGYLAREDASILVVSGSSASLEAGNNMAKILKSYGYKVVGNIKSNQMHTAKPIIVDLSNGKAVYTRYYLEQRLMTSAVETMQLDASIDTSGVQFVIIVGND